MRRSSANAARKTLEGAATSLLNKAASYQGIPGSSFHDTTSLLETAREYARAFRRVETLRRGS